MTNASSTRNDREDLNYSALMLALREFEPRAVILSCLSNRPNGQWPRQIQVTRKGNELFATVGCYPSRGPWGDLDESVAEALCAEHGAEWDTAENPAGVVRRLERHEPPSVAVDCVDAICDALLLASEAVKANG